MAWRKSDRLIEISKGLRPEDSVNRSTLPEDEATLATLSKQVFYSLAQPSLWNADGEPELNASQMEEAMKMCGLKNASVYSRMFVTSKWAKDGDNAPNSLNLTEFQAIVERFARPVRLQKKIRQRVDRYMAENGLGFVHVADDFQTAGSSCCQCCAFLPEKIKIKHNIRDKKRLMDWDATLEGLEDIA